MRKILIAIIPVALMLATLGCNKQATQTTSASSENPPAVSASKMSPEDLGELGAKIKKNPKQADELLSQHGLTAQSFEQAVRKVAESPEQSKRYAAAYKKSS